MFYSRGKWQQTCVEGVWHSRWTILSSAVQPSGAPPFPPPGFKNGRSFCSVLMRGFAFQVDKLVSEIEDHQLLHELSLEDDVAVEELPSELDLSEASSDSSMSGVAPLPPDSVSPDPIVESSVAQLPPDELDGDKVDSVPVPTASLTPFRQSAPPASSVPSTLAHSNVRRRIHQQFFSERLSETSCSESSMDEGQPHDAEGSGEPAVVDPDSQTVESGTLHSSSAASLVDFAEAVASSSPGSAILPSLAPSADVENPPQTPQCVPPSPHQEVASSDMLSTTGRLEDPASTVQESVVTGFPSTSPSPTIPGALSASLRSNPTQEGGVVDLTEAVDAGCPASPEQDYQTEGPQVGLSADPESTDVGTHRSSPVIGVVTFAAGLSPADSTAVFGSAFQGSSLPRSPPAPIMKQSLDQSGSSSTLLCSPEQPTDRPAVTEKLAPAVPFSPGSGQLSLDASKPTVSVGSPDHPLDSAPPIDQAELLQDSFVQLQGGAELTSKVEGEDDGAGSSQLDISLEGGAQVLMDRSVIEQLCAAAAKELAIWNQCLDRMTLDDHPECEFPHVHSIEYHLEYHHKTEFPDKIPLYDEFHDAMLRNDVTVYDVQETDPFTIRYMLARLLRSGDPLPEELLPAMETRLRWHHEQIGNRREKKIASIRELDSRLAELPKSEAASDVVEGEVVPSHRQSDSSFQSDGPEQPDTLLWTIGNVETEEAPQGETAEPPVRPVKLEDQLHRAFADRSVPDCADYPWEHPRFRSSVFRADQEFCGEGLRIPIWFQGEEQIGDEAVQVPIGNQTPVRLVQTALLHQCIEASDAIQCKVQEIKELEQFAADARAACFRAGAGDLQFGLLRAGVTPLDLQFPSVRRETQETGCQANPCTLSTSTQDGPGIRFIRKNLMDCPLQASSTRFMDEYLEDHGYGPVDEEDRSSHPFRRGPRVVGAVGEHFCLVSPIAPWATPASEIQDFRDEDWELYPSRPFRGVHVLAYTEDTFPIILPTHSGQSVITEWLSRAMLEREWPLPKKDSLLHRSEFVRAQHTAVDPAAGGSSHESAKVI